MLSHFHRGVFVDGMHQVAGESKLMTVSVLNERFQLVPILMMYGQESEYYFHVAFRVFAGALGSDDARTTDKMHACLSATWDLMTDVVTCVANGLRTGIPGIQFCATLLLLACTVGLD
jgi:hypothetical protein